MSDVFMPQEVKNLLAQRGISLMHLPNVVGVGIGNKTCKGVDTGCMGVVVLVRKKLPPEHLSATAIIPQSLEGVPTDVVEVGDIWALGANPNWVTIQEAPQERIAHIRPAQPGVSIGHYQVTAGTFGAVVLDRTTKEPLILSNNHVLANSTTGSDNKAKVGDAIWQPGKYDGGTEKDSIARLERFIPLKFKKKLLPIFSMLFSQGGNTADAAVARPSSADLISPEILGLGKVKGIAEPRVGMPVTKSGRTTGVTKGRILAMHASLEVGYDVDKKAVFNDQIVTESMSQGGDSGSLVLNSNNEAIGLLFAGSGQSSIISPIQGILDALNVDLVTS